MCANPGGAYEPRSRWAPFIKSRSGPPKPCNSCGAVSAVARSPSPSLFCPPFFPPAEFPPRPRKLPPGPTALFPHFPSPRPACDPDTQVPQFWRRKGMRASCPWLSLLPSLWCVPPVRPTLSTGETGTMTEFLPRQLPTTSHSGRPVLLGASPSL